MYLVQKKWKKILTEIKDISSDELKKILLKGRYPNNNTFPPLYRLDPEYTYSDSRIEYLCPRKNKTPRRYVIPDKGKYESLVDSLEENWMNNDKDFEMYDSKSILELIKSNKKIVPASVSFLRKRFTDEFLNDIYMDSIIQWKTFTQKYLYEDSVTFSHILDIDIKDFYGQIYVHSIPWALSGDKKKVKKIHREEKSKYRQLRSAKLENTVMSLQDRQTNGIPIGSLGSDLLAELILCRVVRNVEIKYKEMDFIGVRFKDDIKILCKSKEDADQLLDQFASELYEYNLYLNDDKTTIHDDFTNILIKDWKTKLRILPSIDFRFEDKYREFELSNLEEDLMAVFYIVDKEFSSSDGNFWFEFNKRYSKLLKVLVKHKPDARGRIVIWFLNKLSDYPEHTGAILNILMPLVTPRNKKYLKLIMQRGKDISMKRNFDFLMIWLIYYIAEKYLSIEYEDEIIQIYDNLEQDVDEISNESIKVETIRLLEYIKENRSEFKGYMPITRSFQSKWNIPSDYE